LTRGKIGGVPVVTRYVSGVIVLEKPPGRFLGIMVFAMDASPRKVALRLPHDAVVHSAYTRYDELCLVVESRRFYATLPGGVIPFVHYRPVHPTGIR
jgi:hypothetical protein